MSRFIVALFFRERIEGEVEFAPLMLAILQLPIELFLLVFQVLSLLQLQFG